MSKKPLSDLIKLIEAGANPDTGNSDRPVQALVQLAKAAHLSRLRLTMSCDRTTSELLRIAEAGKSSLVFKLDDRYSN